MADTPVIPKLAPYAVDVEAGKTYAWCACGKSQTQPFCDGSHKGTDFAPVMVTTKQNQKLFFCGCKHARKGALCDGAHNKLKKPS